jgi:two-component system, cell cycle sensor histidine kinase and response regulator CckA
MPILIFEPESERIVQANAAACELYGFPPGGLLGQSLKDFTKDIARGEENLAALLRTGRRARYESVHRARDGGEIDVVLSSSVIEYRGQKAVLCFIRDVTERKRAEEALTQSEQRYKDFIAHSADAVWRVELEKPLPCNLAPDEAVEHLLKYGCLAECNDALARIVGLSSAGEILGKRIGEFVGPDDHGRLESFRQVFRQGWAAKPIRFEATDRAGNRKILERTAVPIIQDGCVIRIWGTTRDITELKRIEGGLRESDERFRTIFESAGIGITLVDLEGRIIHANRTLQRILGYTEEELCRMVFTEFTHPEDRDLNWKFYSEMVDGKRSNFEMEKRYIRKDGTVVWVHLTVSLIRNQAGRPKYAVAMVGEITERKRAEEGLVRLGHAIDASGEVIFMTDCRGVITSINPEFTRIYGYTAAEVVGMQTPRILKSGERTEGDYEKFWKSILAKKVVRGDIINKTKDGRMVNINSSVSPILDDFGRITGFVAIQRDLTERRQLEEQFRQAQKMEAVGRLAGGVAHDFNNLLTIINGYSQLLIEGDILDEAHRTQLIEIRKAGERAASLTKQLLAFSRRQVLEPKVLDLSAVVDGMHKMLSRILGEDVELRILTKGLLGRVKADVTQIEQVILNLAVNARDAMPHGGLLSIEIANAVLDEDYAKTHSTVTPGRYVSLAVSDTGIGMDAKTLGRIFEPFYTTKEQGKGTGLGLSTVFGIVKQSGGHINVYSEPGKGTTFRIYLQEVESPAAEAVEAEASRPPGGSETILLVEDEEGVRAIATRVLKDYGYKVLESSSAEDAVRIGDEYRPAIDLLLTDVVMPGLSGRNVAEHLTFSRPGIKVLFMSGYTDDAIIHHGVLEAGVAFLQKPFTPEGLAARVREVLDTPLK